MMAKNQKQAAEAARARRDEARFLMNTYRRPAVVYEAASIASGASLFLTHCTSCHGAGGRGDGPLAGNLPTRPANLTEPHTALHTGGDMFWWLTHGMRGKAMPGFAATLPEDERWDVINFLRALSIGYQARIIDDRVVPEKPWLGAPDFSFSHRHAAVGRLNFCRATTPAFMSKANKRRMPKSR